jgi:hypothetical protein
MTPEQFQQLLEHIDHWGTQIDNQLESIKNGLIDVETAIDKLNEDPT